MTEAVRQRIIELWQSGIPIQQIYRMLPCRKFEAERMVAELRADGTLADRRKRDWAIEKVAKAYDNGMRDVDDLSETFGYARNTIIKYLRLAGRKRHRPHRYKERAVNRTAELIIAELSKGEKTLAEIAKKYGVSRQYVHQLKRRL